MTTHEFEMKAEGIADELVNLTRRISELTEAVPSAGPHAMLARRAAACSVTKLDEARLWLAELCAERAGASQ